MNWPLLRKNWLETRWLLGGCVLLMASMFWMRVWLISRVDSGRFQQILELLPDSFRSMTRVDFSWIVTHIGRLSMGFEEPMVILIMSIWAISRGTDIVSGELSRGTMEMMLAQPISRRKTFLVPLGYAVGGVLLLALASLLGTFMGILTIEANEASYPTFRLPMVRNPIPIPFAEPTEYKISMSELVTIGSFWPAAVNLFSLGIFMLGVSTLFSSYDRFRWRSIGGVSIVLILMTLVKISAMSQPSLRWLGWLSGFTAYEPALFVSQTSAYPDSLWSLYFYDPKGVFHFAHWVFDFILLGLGIGMIFHACRVFEKRDLPAPL